MANKSKNANGALGDDPIKLDMPERINHKQSIRFNAVGVNKDDPPILTNGYFMRSAMESAGWEMGKLTGVRVTVEPIYGDA